jgi:hypothetical protein
MIQNSAKGFHGESIDNMQELKTKCSSFDHGCERASSEFWKSPFDSINGAARVSRYLERRYVARGNGITERRSRNIIGKRYWKNKKRAQGSHANK